MTPIKKVLKALFLDAGPIIGTNDDYEAFIGIHDQFAEGDWTTVHGDSLSKTGFTKWSDRWNGQPDNWSSKQHCGALLREGGMDDTYCYKPFAFFCELPVSS
ncbi:hemolymph lipopolysaccharide-binding protein isoform X4 [Megachile rotundata]|uniref:hemolymph lipopolysaccharide-binding protein isoform X4 n=1 Tax=Megachile rotundata TaxID=143995 RepID=UPI0006153CDA|nr:PREDICTED: hemolymph lipopolysaccharide-binding protein-like isoform X4 [Megachile rotundata]